MILVTKKGKKKVECYIIKLVNYKSSDDNKIVATKLRCYQSWKIKKKVYTKEQEIVASLNEHSGFHWIKRFN